MLGRIATYQTWLLTCSLWVGVVPAHSARADELRLNALHVPSPAQTAALAMSLHARADTRGAPTQPDSSSWLESPWFWAGVVGAVAAGVAVALVVAHSNEEPGVPQGNLDVSLQVLSKAPCGPQR
jgi:hypothetical protein